MSDTSVKITIIANGPAQVEGGRIEVIMPDGAKITQDKPVFLCRCGKSKNKPFCDGAHKTSGFEG